MQGYTSKVQELNEVIEKLYIAKEESDYDEICDMLDKIYLIEDGQVDDNFRHEYASISGKIRELNAEEIDGEKIFSLDNLVHNISCVYDYAVDKDKPYVKSLFKLKDHVGLEAGRIALVDQLRWQINNGQESVKSHLEYSKRLADSIGEEVQKSKNLLDELQKTAKENNTQIEKSKETLIEVKNTSEMIEDKVNSVQKDSITILGIFASIVLSFTAGMVFTSSVLENIHQASAYRIIGIVLLIGIVLTNLIALLLMYIDRVRMLKLNKMTMPKSVKIMNVCYIIGFFLDFIAWVLLEKLDCINIISNMIKK